MWRGVRTDPPAVSCTSSFTLFAHPVGWVLLRLCFTVEKTKAQNSQEQQLRTRSLSLQAGLQWTGQDPALRTGQVGGCSHWGMCLRWCWGPTPLRTLPLSSTSEGEPTLRNSSVHTQPLPAKSEVLVVLTRPLCLSRSSPEGQCPLWKPQSSLSTGPPSVPLPSFQPDSPG